MFLKVIPVYVLLMVITQSKSKDCRSSFRHQVKISGDIGHDETSCLNRSTEFCRTLDFVLQKLMDKQWQSLRNSTKVRVDGNQTLKENYNLTNLTDFALCGNENTGSKIQCNNGSGLIIQSSKGIAIEYLSFYSCGSKQVSQDHLHTSYQTGIFVMNTVDVTVNHCNVSNSPGIGMTLVNVGGMVTFNHTIFRQNINRNSTKITRFGPEHLQVGGGLAVELTNDGGLPPFNSNNNMYILQHCKFIDNGCYYQKYKQQLDPNQVMGNKSIIFGSGGGLGVFLKGSAKDNAVVMEHCHFKLNIADWGAGYYFLFQDEVTNNSVHLSHIVSESNHARFAGGGGRFSFFPHVNFSDVFRWQPNYFKQSFCTYRNNSASWGGGISIFGSTELPEHSHQDTNLSFSHCKWLENQAIVGSALGLLSNWLDPELRIKQPVGKGLAYTIKLSHCKFNHNNISHLFQEYGTSIIGTGAIYTDIAPIIMQNVSLCFNNGTALVVDWSYVYILDNVLFYNNSGSKGGAVALYGRSKLILSENAVLNFTRNIALLQGGAIFAYSQGPNLKAFDIQILDRSTCFFSYQKPYLRPENWTARVFFDFNIAPDKSGNSIYADTLQFCRSYGNLSVAMEWKPVFKYQSLNNSTQNPEVVTDPVSIKTKTRSWTVFPGETFYPEIELRDEKDQLTNGLLKISVNSADNSTRLGDQVSQYMFILSNRSSVPLSVQSTNRKGNYNVILSSVYTQVIRTTVKNITTLGCYGGYKFNHHERKCVCLDAGEMPFGYVRCGNDGKTIYLKIGYWAEMARNGRLHVSFCPPGYCKCADRLKTTYAKDECVFKNFDNSKEQCSKNRQGKLCGTCKEGFSVVVGKQDCRRCTNIGILWLIPLVVGMTLIILVIIYFEIDFFSGPLNSWLYTYHIILLLPAHDQYLDPLSTLVISLTRGEFDISTGRCFWDGMDALQKLTLEYLMPFYFLAFLYFVNKLLRNFPNIALTRHTCHHALVTIVIVSYASLLQNTMTILKPVIIDGKWYVYVRADLDYFGKEHLPYAIPATFVLFLMVIPFPFIIAFNSFFTKRFHQLRSFIPLFQVLQSPYRANRSWFASYYIFCRLVFFTVAIASPEFPHTQLVFYEAICVLILTIFVLLQPYTEDNMFFFRVDTFFLSLLCLIVCCINAMEANTDRVTVLFFAVLIRIMTYIPLIYSFGLFVLYVRQSWNNYMQRRQERGDAALL